MHWTWMSFSVPLAIEGNGEAWQEAVIIFPFAQYQLFQQPLCHSDPANVSTITIWSCLISITLPDRTESETVKAFSHQYWILVATINCRQHCKQKQYIFMDLFSSNICLYCLCNGRQILIAIVLLDLRSIRIKHWGKSLKKKDMRDGLALSVFYYYYFFFFFFTIDLCLILTFTPLFYDSLLILQFIWCLWWNSGSWFGTLKTKMPLVKFCDSKYYLYTRKDGEIPKASHRTSQNNGVLPNKRFSISLVFYVLI